MPWTALCEVIEPHYPKTGNGRPSIGLERTAPKAKDFTNQCTRRNGIVDEALKAKNRNNSRIRSRVPAVLKVTPAAYGIAILVIALIHLYPFNVGSAAIRYLRPTFLRLDAALNNAGQNLRAVKAQMPLISLTGIL